MLTPQDLPERIWPLPARRINGIGPKAAARLADLGILYWLARLWIKTSRGEMNDDPIVYALRDRTSRITIVWILLAFVLASTLRL